MYILATWSFIFPNRSLIYCTVIGGLVTVNVNKARSWELNTQGEREGPVTCVGGKCRKSAQFRSAKVDEVNRRFFSSMNEGKKNMHNCSA